MQPTRTLIFVPTNRENMIRRAHETPADVIVLDLEDGVAPDGKAAGRAAVGAAIESLKAAGKTVHVRINHIDTGMTKDDLAAIVGPGLDAILYPKPQGASAVRELDVLIREAEYHKEGVRPGTIGLIPMIETSRALLRCEEIALASTRIIGLAVGGEDYAADLGVARTKEATELGAHTQRRRQRVHRLRPPAPRRHLCPPRRRRRPAGRRCLRAQDRVQGQVRYPSRAGRAGERRLLTDRGRSYQCASHRHCVR